MKRTTEQFVQEASSIHNGFYDYSQSNYKNAKTKLTITCPVHGDFEQLPASHLRGFGCRQCGSSQSAKKRSTSGSDFVKKAISKQQGKYTYQNVVYKNTESKVSITCPTHGDFEQTPHSHLSGAGCPQCRSDFISEIRSKPVEQFIQQAEAVHKGKYVYDLSNYQNEQSSIRIKCAKHGEFYQKACMHLKGQGCPQCGRVSAGLKGRMSLDEFVGKSNKLHTEKYSYTSYTKSSEKTTIICPIHGEFEQKPNDHLDGHGCPRCSVHESQIETKVFDFVKSLCPDVVSRDRSGIAGYGDKQPLELDVYVPSKQLAIEVNGLHWHSSYCQPNKGRQWVLNHQLNKLQNCLANNVNLLTFYEDEINEQFPIVQKIIQHRLGVSQETIYARNTQVIDLDWNTAKQFLHQTHLQSAGKPNPAKGLVDKQGNLVAVMVFGKVRSVRGETATHIGELIRFSSSLRVIGGCSKLLSSFLSGNSFSEVISYSDRRFSSGQLYQALGFECVNTSYPDYVYVVNGQRKHKTNFKKSVLASRFSNFDPNLTEEVNCYRNRVFKLYNCGLQKWRYKVN